MLPAAVFPAALFETGRLSAILDRTAAQVGGAGSDFGLIHGALGRAGLEGLLEPLRRPVGQTWPALLASKRNGEVFCGTRSSGG